MTEQIECFIVQLKSGEFTVGERNIWSYYDGGELHEDWYIIGSECRCERSDFIQILNVLELPKNPTRELICIR